MGGICIYWLIRTEKYVSAWLLCSLSGEASIVSETEREWDVLVASGGGSQVTTAVHLVEHDGSSCTLHEIHKIEACGWSCCLSRFGQ